MSIKAVGFVPAAPLLIPDVAGGAAHLDETLREACLAAVQGLIDRSPSEIVVVARTPNRGRWSDDATWDFSGFGAPQPPPSDAPTLPWSLGIGAWLLDACAWTGGRDFIGVDSSGVAGSTVTADAAILAIGDGSGCRTEKAPGHLDPRAAEYDAAIATGLAGGDAASLGGLDPELSRELLCAGAPVWRWLASVLGDQQVTSASLEIAEAPYGVGYFVASWLVT